MRFGFRASAFWLALFLCALIGNAAHALKVTGTVKDCDGQPIPGVTVRITIGLEDAVPVTPVNGEWSYEVACAGSDDVQVDLVFEDGRKTIVKVFQNVNCATGELEFHFDCKTPPNLEQPGLQDCAPTAAASLIGWLRQNGYPNLGEGTLQDLLNEIRQDARTSANTGTDFNDLIRALNAIIDGSEYKGCLRAFVPPRVHFPFNDTAFMQSKVGGAPFFVLLQDQNSHYAHYVLVYDVTVGNGTIKLQVMDPAKGALREIELKLSGNRYRGSYNNGGGDRTVYINAIICVEPRAKASSAQQGTQRKISYTPHFQDSNHRPEDFHVRVYDCASTYTVQGLPPGWNFEVVENSDGCYLSFFNDAVSTAVLFNNTSFTVTYEGENPIGRAPRVANFTHSGTNDPADQPEPRFEAVTVLPIDVSTTPPAPLAPVLSFAYAPSASTTRGTYDWQVPLGQAPSIDHYEVYSATSGDFIATTTQSSFTTDVVTSNTFQSFTVAARYATGILSADAPEAFLYVNNDKPTTITQSSRTAFLLLPFNDCPSEFGDCGDSNYITMTVENPGGTFFVYLSAGIGETATPVPPELGVPHERFYHIAVSNIAAQKQVILAVPFDEDELGEGSTRLLVLRDGMWEDITLGISEETGRIVGQTTTLAHEVGTLVIVTVPRDPVHGWRIE